MSFVVVKVNFWTEIYLVFFLDPIEMGTFIKFVALVEYCRNLAQTATIVLCLLQRIIDVFFISCCDSTTTQQICLFIQEAHEPYLLK
jgi:hypothetical protein